VKRVHLGTSVQDREIVALKVTKDANTVPDGSRPAVLYNSLQHAREWIGIEVNRRLLHYFLDNYGQDDEITALVDSIEMWFVLCANPDGYQYTFDTYRNWRKNLRDNDGDGEVGDEDGVDLNRNFGSHWGYDNDGSSPFPGSTTFRGPSASSEPETMAMQGLLGRVDFEFMVNYHSAAALILYGIGWQDLTRGADDPIFAALAGTLANPATEGFEPMRSSGLYITNGETCDYVYAAGTLCFTPELSRAPRGSGGTGFEFPDDDALIQEEFLKNLPFALDVVRSTAGPARPVSHLGNTVEPFYVDSFHVSYGDPQPVQVNAARHLGPVTMQYRINDGVERAVLAEEWPGGEQYGGEGKVNYHWVRAEVTGTKPGDEVTVWFEAGHEQTEPFTYTVTQYTDARVLVVAAEDYTGLSPQYEKTDGPSYLQAHLDALAANGIEADIYDVDAEGRRAPDPLAVLGHYAVVIWYTGDDIITREPGMVDRTVSRLAVDMMLAMRDYLNEGGKLLYAGEYAGFQYFARYEYDPVANAPCDPSDRGVDGCVRLQNDFLQYYFGADAYYDNFGSSRSGEMYPLREIEDPFDGLGFAFSTPPEGSQVHTAAFRPTSVRMPADEFPQFASRRVAAFDRPGDKPHTGDYALYSDETYFSYQRLMRTVDLTGETSGDLTFWIVRETRQPYDAVFVEVHTVGEDDWTTLPDQNGHTTSDAALSCTSSAWYDRFPFLVHYMTRDDSGDQPRCLPTGTTGSWNAATANSYNEWEEWSVDLTPYAGKEIEVSITYLSSRIAFFGVMIDDVSLSTGESTSFEEDLGGWVVAGPPEGHDPNNADYVRVKAADIPLPEVGPIVVADDTIIFAFGIEALASEALQTEVIGRAMDYLLPKGPPPNTIYLPTVRRLH